MKGLRQFLDAEQQQTWLDGDATPADAEKREWGLRMLMVSRCIERIGDHAVDIGEQTVYLVTAQFAEFTDASH